MCVRLCVRASMCPCMCASVRPCIRPPVRTSGYIVPQCRGRPFALQPAGNEEPRCCLRPSPSTRSRPVQPPACRGAAAVGSAREQARLLAPRGPGPGPAGQKRRWRRRRRRRQRQGWCGGRFGMPSFVIPQAVWDWGFSRQAVMLTSLRPTSTRPFRHRARRRAPQGDG